MGKLTIRHMFPDVDRGAFLDALWAKEIVVGHGPIERLGAIAEEKALSSVEALLRIPPANITAQWQSGARDGAVNVEPKQALEFYKQGRYTLAMDVGEHRVIKAAMRAIGNELGTPILSKDATAVAAVKGASKRLHWIEPDVFVVQMSGRSVWNVAPNQSIPRPTAPYLGPDAPHPEVVALARGAAIKKPARTKRVELAPGSVLHLPRGTWQRWKAMEEGVFLVFRLQGATWADWFLNQTRAGLAPDVAFRLPSVGATSTRAAERSIAQADIARLLPVFRERVRAWGKDLYLDKKRPSDRSRRTIARS